MNGQIRYSSPSVNGTYEVGTQASFSCDPGFALIGKNESVCDASDEMDTMGNWTSSAPSCLRMPAVCIIIYSSYVYGLGPLLISR